MMSLSTLMEGSGMWLGIPFLYVKERVADTISIDKLPLVSVDTSFSWETIIAAFISGLVPALISIYVIKENNDSIKYQQAQEDRRQYSAHIRVVVSEYVYQLNSVMVSYTQWIHRHSSTFEPIDKDLIKKVSSALTELERFKVSLLISIPEDDAGKSFKVKVNDISNALSNIIKKKSPTKSDIEIWDGMYLEFISIANQYLTR